MKTVLSLLSAFFLLFIGNASAQDTARKQPSPLPAKKVESSQPKDTNPIINKIAVSDPGMPADKPTSTKRSSAGKSDEKKKRKKSESAVTPK